MLVLKVMSALVDIALTISIQKDQAQRQYEAERQKSSARRAADRLDTLTAKRKEVRLRENYPSQPSLLLLRLARSE